MKDVADRTGKVADSPVKVVDRNGKVKDSPTKVADSPGRKKTASMKSVASSPCIKCGYALR